jgi:hypothetical protein
MHHLCSRYDTNDPPSIDSLRQEIQVERFPGSPSRQLFESVDLPPRQRPARAHGMWRRVARSELRKKPFALTSCAGQILLHALSRFHFRELPPYRLAAHL